MQTATVCCCWSGNGISCERLGVFLHQQILASLVFLTLQSASSDIAQVSSQKPGANLVRREIFWRVDHIAEELEVLFLPCCLTCSCFCDLSCSIRLSPNTKATFRLASLSCPRNRELCSGFPRFRGIASTVLPQAGSLFFSKLQSQGCSTLE